MYTPARSAAATLKVVQPPDDGTGDPSVEVPVGHLSPSGSALFEECPRRWKFRYIDKLPEPSSPEAVVGTFAHRVLEQLMALPAEDRSVDEARRIAGECWPEFRDGDEYQTLGLDEAETRAFMWQAWQAVEGLWEVEDPAGIEVLACESALEADLGGVPFKGTADRIERNTDGETVVTDYKSGKAPPPGYGGRHMHQVLLYAAALEQQGQPVDRVAVVYLGERRVSVRATPQLVARAVDRLADTWESIQQTCGSGEFAPKTGPLCSWCPHTGICPEGAAEAEARAAARAAAA